MPSNDPKNALDHLILFLPANPETNLPKIPSFISDNFTLTPGGTHADGLTSNTLILLADGCYIELITFTPSASPDDISTHWWAPNATSPGWADWCLTNSLTPAASHALVQASHQDPRHGGRTRPDGVAVKWAVTFPRGPHGGQPNRALTPFFCHDETPRSTRVPLTTEKTAHPSGALGVHSLTVLVPDAAALDATRDTYRTLLTDLEHADATHACFGAERVVPVEKLGGVKVKLVLPRDEGDRKKVGERGFWYGDVVLAAKAREGKPAGTKERLDGGEDDLRGLWVVYT